jgi:hypothetical protein
MLIPWEAGVVVVVVVVGAIGNTYLFVPLGNPAVIARHEVEPILKSPQETVATSNPREGAVVAGLPCEVNEKGADGEEEESGNNPAWGQRLYQH